MSRPLPAVRHNRGFQENDGTSSLSTSSSSLGSNRDSDDSSTTNSERGSVTTQDDEETLTSVPNQESAPIGQRSAQNAGHCTSNNIDWVTPPRQQAPNYHCVSGPNTTEQATYVLGDELKRPARPDEVMEKRQVMNLEQNHLLKFANKHVAKEIVKATQMKYKLHFKGHCVSTISEIRDCVDLMYR